MKKVIYIALLSLTIAACGSKTKMVKEKVYVDAPTAVVIQNVTPYQEGHRIAKNIREECTIDSQLPQFIVEYGTEKGIEINAVDTVTKDSAESVLIVEITDAVSRGNAFVGHRKFTEIEGTLFNKGKKVASFRGSRVSGGGMFAGFKGSCSVLGRTVKALGSDVSAWLQNPWKDALLGDS